MTWTGIDAVALADDNAANPVLIRVSDDLHDTAVTRTGQTSRTWLPTNRQAFSTPSNGWRCVPFFRPMNGYTDGLTVRVRYLLDSGALSGITAPTDAGEARIFVNGVVGDTETVTVTGATVAEVTCTIGLEHVGNAGFVRGEIQFRSKRGSSAGTWHVVDMVRQNGLVIGTPAPTPTPVTASAPHLEFDYGGAGRTPATLHVCKVDASGGASDPYMARIWPFLDEGEDLTWGSGKVVTLTAYHLPAWEIQGASFEFTASESRINAPDVRQLQSGGPTFSGPPLALDTSIRTLWDRRRRVYSTGPSLTAGTQTSLLGMRTGTTTKTTIGGARMTRESGDRGLSVVVLFAPRATSYIGTSIEFKVELEEVGGSSNTETADVLIAATNQPRRTFGSTGTLHQLNVGDNSPAVWSPADTGAEGDVERLQYTILTVDYPGDVGDDHQLTVSATGADIWIGEVASWGR